MEELKKDESVEEVKEEKKEKSKRWWDYQIGDPNTPKIVYKIDFFVLLGLVTIIGILLIISSIL